MVVRDLLRQAVQAAAAEGLLRDPPSQIPFERPKRAEHGDYATNVALSLAKTAGKPPRAIGEAIAKHLRAVGGADLAEATVAGPGFVNLRFSDDFWQRRLLEIRQAGKTWGAGAPKASPKLCVEYLSANPTGPLHFAHGRHAAVGDSLTRLLRFAGYDVVREFYLNDAGNQVAMLALSVWTRYMEAARAADPQVPEIAFPENGYRGDYIRGIGQQLLERDGTRWVAPAPPADIEPIKRFAIASCLDMIRATLVRFDVDFDVWQSERELHETGEVKATLAVLEQAGYIDRRDNAVWLRTTVLWGDDKDRVVVKSDGLPTYLLADIAYHRKKLARGFDDLCDIWGADHHGHIPRMQAALKALGADPERLTVILIQMVSLLRDGQPVAMGKREGEFVTLDEVIDEVGRDATRFFYLMRRHDTPLEFDLELAKRQSMDNPVYYAQYAHARCASLLRRAAELEAPPYPADPRAGARPDAARGDRHPAPAVGFSRLRGRRRRRARAAPAGAVHRRAGGRVPELLHPPAEGPRRQHPAAGAAAGRRLARHLGLAAHRRSARVGGGHSPGAGDRAVAGRGFRPQRNEAHGSGR